MNSQQAKRILQLLNAYTDIDELWGDWEEEGDQEAMDAYDALTALAKEDTYLNSDQFDTSNDGLVGWGRTN